MTTHLIINILQFYDEMFHLSSGDEGRLRISLEKGTEKAVPGLTFSGKYRMIVDGINNSASPGSY